VALMASWETIEHIETGADGELWVSTNGGVSGFEECSDPLVLAPPEDES